MRPFYSCQTMRKQDVQGVLAKADANHDIQLSIKQVSNCRVGGGANLFM